MAKRRKGEGARRHETSLEHKRIAGDVAEMRRVAETTFYTLTPQMAVNAALNIEGGLLHAQGIKSLIEDYHEGAGRGHWFGDRWGLIIAAGPSISRFKHLETLAEFYEGRKFTIIAVDAALPALLDLEVYPDYVVSTDPQEATSQFYADVEERREGLHKAGTMAVLPGTVNPKVIKMWPLPRKSFYWPASPFGKRLEASQLWDLMAPLGIVNVHGHVTGACLTIANALGLQGAAIIGGDYSYEAGTTYEESFWYKWMVELGKPHEEILDNLKPEQFQDPWTGEAVWTDVVFLQYIGYITNWLASLKTPWQLINCSQRGLLHEPTLIKSAKFRTWLEALDGQGDKRPGEGGDGGRAGQGAPDTAPPEAPDGAVQGL
ncbi:DUF115 domain-containing protein [Patescibacteria group bacterium]|nr:DUF115 domain-containing protein [Patescibacteria group bacterium]